MAIEIFMPKLSSTMEVGTLLQWFKEEGDPVEIGEPLFEIMTDKINIEVEAYEEGTLLKKYYEPDEEIPVNQVIGFIGEESEEVPSSSPGLSSDSSSDVDDSEDTREGAEENVASQPSGEVDVEQNEKVRATPAARRVARERDLQLSAVAGSGPKGRVHEKDVVHYSEENQGKKITPLAKKVAENEQVSVDNLTGTGANGKIVKDDVTDAIQSATGSANTSSPKKKKLAGMRKVIADRMQESVNTAPHVTLTSDIDMTKVKELRSQLLPTIEKQTGLRLSYTEVIAKAVGVALSRFPSVNASLINNEIIYNEEVNVGLAVAVEDGLMVPVLKKVNSKGLSTLTKEAKDIARRAREQKLQSDELKGATFTVSNLGMYAIDAFTPIINLPETAILGIGRIQDKPVVVDQTVEVRPMMAVSLSFDHRAVDGAPAAAFLTEVKRILENPFELLA
ncbi:dihydrolipoamide acetyltransferase family protein [Pseudalkalibacillus caeni]|uniref:Dihydrolipoamide acetyltransferase component of pyruvate dehydrogenase complex n=1 Tax=Exobacillus caeni TaxID=2574798 RepID=A0A5R9FDT7_9BACL|nr:dihydrolipoamide acetyltransferase family protein [Pseudalkalibacillus caeni]TLS38724.1 2-oxo acid dehydrogenase subunit E2 [Pseudalkalibacillus caeni]